MNKFNLDDNTPQVWLLFALGDDEKQHYSGNSGYTDKISEKYEYQNRVSNSRNISEGDLVLLRNKTQLIGLARIEIIKSRLEEQEQLNCPFCGETNFYSRETKKPEYRCKICTNEFDKPTSKTVQRKKFTAYFGDSFVPAQRAVSIQALRKACPKYNKQSSIQLIDIKQIEATLLDKAPSVAKLLNKNGDLDYLKADDAKEDEITEDLDITEYSRIEGDRRQLVMRQIRERRGQSKFRQALRLRYGGKCMITGCKLFDVVEAAHISPYRGSEDNHPENGLLLRADLHTLFDLDLLGIEPETLEIKLHSKVLDTRYRNLEGRKLICSKFKPDTEAMRSRWSLFLQRCNS